MTPSERSHREQGHEVKTYARAEVVSETREYKNCGGSAWSQCSCGARFDERPISFIRWN